MIPQREISPQHLTTTTPKNYGGEFLCYAGGTIAANDIVVPNGVVNGHVRVVQADTDASATSRNVLWVAMHAATSGQPVRCSPITPHVTMNTAASSIGAPVYLSSTAGGITLTEPATGGVVVGRVLTVGATGHVLLAPSSNSHESSAGSGSDSLSWTINQDGAAASDQDPVLILEGGDGGAELIHSWFTQDSSLDLVWFGTRLAGGAWRTPEFGIGREGETTAALDAFFSLNAATDAGAARQLQFQWLGQEMRLDMVQSAGAFAGIRPPVGCTAVWDFSQNATGEADVILGANLASAMAWRVGADDVLTLVTTAGSERIAAARRMTTTDGVGSGTAKVIGGRSYASLADSTVVTNIAVPTAADTTFAIPANTLKEGSVLKIKAICRSIGVNGADTIQYSLRINDGGVADVLVASTALNVGANNRVKLEGHSVFRAAPGAAVAASHYYESCDLSIGARTAGPAAGAPITHATDAIITVDVLVTHSAANAGNQSVVESLYVEII